MSNNIVIVNFLGEGVNELNNSFSRYSQFGLVIIKSDYSILAGFVIINTYETPHQRHYPYL